MTRSVQQLSSLLEKDVAIVVAERIDGVWIVGNGLDCVTSLITGPCIAFNGIWSPWILLMFLLTDSCEL